MIALKIISLLPQSLNESNNCTFECIKGGSLNWQRQEQLEFLLRHQEMPGNDTEMGNELNAAPSVVNLELEHQLDQIQNVDIEDANKKEACRADLAEMVILDELPFRSIEGKGFRKFCGVLQPKFSVPCRITVSKDCMKLYEDMKLSVKEQHKDNKLCLTTDTWTSVQNLNYMCLTAHFIDFDWKYQKRILNFMIVESHRGEAIRKVIESCLETWGIQNIFTVTVDNESSNNGAISHLKKKDGGWPVLF